MENTHCADVVDVLVGEKDGANGGRIDTGNLQAGFHLCETDAAIDKKRLVGAFDDIGISAASACQGDYSHEITELGMFGWKEAMRRVRSSAREGKAR